MKKLKRYRVWAEGFCITGDSGKCQFLGEALGTSFKDACRYLMRHSTSYDPATNSYWACRLYPTKAQAKRSFG